MVDHKILSPHYEGETFNSHGPKVLSTDIKSGKYFTPPTVSSWPREQNMPQQPYLITTPAGKTYAITKTSGNTFVSNDYFERGHFSQVDDGPIGCSPFVDWIKNGTENPPNLNNYIPRISDIANIDSVAYITGATPLKLWIPNRQDTQVNLYTTPTLVRGFDINAHGRLVSELDTFKQKLRSDLLFNETNHLHYEIAKWAEFLDNEGIHPVKYPFVGLGIEKTDSYAGNYQASRILVASDDLHAKAKALMKRHGLSESEAVSAMERSIMMHEYAHASGIGGGFLNERRQGLLQAKFYKQLAREFSGTKWARIYNALADEAAEYAQDHSLTNAILHTMFSDPSQPKDLYHVLNHKFYHEGLKLGKKGKALEKYVKDRVKNTYGVLLTDADEDSDAEHKEGNNLEGIVKEMSREASSRGIDATEFISAQAATKLLGYSEKAKSNRNKKSNYSERQESKENYEDSKPVYNSRREKSENKEVERDSEPAEKADASESGGEAAAE